MWQQRSAAEDQRTSTYNGDIRETRTDQENKDPVRDLLPCLSVGHCLGKRTGPSLVLLPHPGNSWIVPLSSWLLSDGGGKC